jgi:hypothetical protein
LRIFVALTLALFSLPGILAAGRAEAFGFNFNFCFGGGPRRPPMYAAPWQTVPPHYSRAPWGLGSGSTPVWPPFVGNPVLGPAAPPQGFPGDGEQNPATGFMPPPRNDNAVTANSDAECRDQDTGRRPMKCRLMAATALTMAGAGLAEAGPQFTADAMQTQSGQELRYGRLTVGDKGSRFEFQEGGQPVVQIVRPADGVTLTLFPWNRTYIETKAEPGAPIGEFHPSVPCKSSPEVECKKEADEAAAAGGKIERWSQTPKNGPGSRIWWDSKRKMAVREEMADGRVMQATLRMTMPFSGRTVENWEILYMSPNGQFRRGMSLYAPDLGFAVVEQQPGGVMRELRNISVGAPDAKLFELPEGYKKIDAATAEGTADRQSGAAMQPGLMPQGEAPKGPMGPTGPMMHPGQMPMHQGMPMPQGEAPKGPMGPTGPMMQPGQMPMHQGMPMPQGEAPKGPMGPTGPMMQPGQMPMHQGMPMPQGEAPKGPMGPTGPMMQPGQMPMHQGMPMPQGMPMWPMPGQPVPAPAEKKDADKGAPKGAAAAPTPPASGPAYPFRAGPPASPYSPYPFQPYGQPAFGPTANQPTSGQPQPEAQGPRAGAGQKP